MPIKPTIATRRISPEEFKHLAYDVMEQVYAIHNDFGRFFDERIYKQELAARMNSVELEIAVDVIHQSFSKRYFADALVHRAGLFEFKAAEAIHDRHVGQTINYLLLFDLPHAKVINIRPGKVESRFVNCHQQLTDLRLPVVDDSDFDKSIAGAGPFRDTLDSLVADWGAGLELSLYVDAVTHFAGGEETAVQDVLVAGSKGPLGTQRMRLIAPDVAFHISGVAEPEDFAKHTHRLLKHTKLKAIHWANITSSKITYVTIR